MGARATLFICRLYTLYGTKRNEETPKGRAILRLPRKGVYVHPIVRVLSILTNGRRVCGGAQHAVAISQTLTRPGSNSVTCLATRILSTPRSVRSGLCGKIRSEMDGQLPSELITSSVIFPDSEPFHPFIPQWAAVESRDDSILKLGS
jgi:hypothetical protein